MRKSFIVLAGLAFLAGPVFMASSASADCEGMREFTGKIQKFKKSGKKAGFVLDNNQGDKVKFQRAEKVAVVDTRAGEKKAESWDDLKNGLWVGACWKFTDNPRLAYEVTIHEEPQDSASDD